jgi:hypothetical protein
MGSKMKGVSHTPYPLLENEMDSVTRGMFGKQGDDPEADTLAERIAANIAQVLSSLSVEDMEELSEDIRIVGIKSMEELENGEVAGEDRRYNAFLTNMAGFATLSLDITRLIASGHSLSLEPVMRGKEKGDNN